MNTKKGLLPLLWSKLKAESEKHKANETPEIYLLEKIKQEYVIVLLSILAILMQLLITLHAATAQEKQPAGLHIGDKVPDVTITHLIRYPSKTAKLSDFRGKVLVLEFWATWCSTCIAEMPHLSRVRDSLNGRMEVLLVTAEPVSIVQKFLARNKIMAGLNLPVAPADTSLRLLFPHRTIPHTAVIGPAQTVAAITSPRYVTVANLQRVLEGKPVTVVTKQDILTADVEKSILDPANGFRRSGLLYYSALTRYVPGLPSQQGNRSDSLHRRLYFTNRPLIALYRYALQDRHVANMVLRLKDGQEEEKDPQKRKEASFCYELTAPAGTPYAQLHQIMLGELNRYLGLEVTTVKNEKTGDTLVISPAAP